jgi:hypothetical protein
MEGKRKWRESANGVSTKVQKECEDLTLVLAHHKYRIFPQYLNPRYLLDTYGINQKRKERGRKESGTEI